MQLTFGIKDEICYFTHNQRCYGFKSCAARDDFIAKHLLQALDVNMETEH